MAILMGMPEELRGDVLYRMGSMESVRAQTLRNLEETLADDLRSVITGQVKVGGTEAVAEVLSYAGEHREGVACEAEGAGCRNGGGDRQSGGER